MKQKLLSILATSAILVLFAVTAIAQVTTSSITGTVYDSQGGLVGATVKATHTPSGTVYYTTTQNGGNFTIQGMRIGGPYEIEVSFIGLNTEKMTDVNLLLGEPFSFKVTLSEENLTLGEAVIIGARKSAFSAEKTGAATNVSSQQMRTLPSINRSIEDFTRLSPYSGGSGSFGGRDNRFNHISIDGAGFNNSFGLSSSNLPGGDAQPISLDAIEEIQVNIAPYDVRQANFTGAGINAITRSGSNTFRGTAYTYYRNESFNGTKVEGTDIGSQAKTSTNIYGGSISGPIIKNKLFFFVNGEYENSPYPGMTWKATRGNNAGQANVSRVLASDLDEFSAILKDKYNYNTGPYEDYGTFSSKNYKILARVDWNINNNHKLMLRYNYVHSTNDQIVNGTSTVGTRASSYRVSSNAMSFKNTNYNFLNTVSSFTAELNSTFGGGKFANQLLATYTGINDKRDSDSDIFPMIDIWDGNKNAYMSAGYELFTYNNGVKNNVYSIIDNFTYYMGKHTFTAGVSFELMTFANSYMRYGTSYYKFADFQTFKNHVNGVAGANPLAYGMTYAYDTNNTKPTSDLDFGQFSAYVQDEFKITDNFKLTAGLRIDLPMYMNDLEGNPAVSLLTFANGEKLNLSEWPKSKILFSPRLGFNWDVFNDKTLKVRGGTGLFTGRLPFVFFTNQPTNGGMIQNTVQVTNAADLASFTFNPDPMYHVINDTKGYFPKTAGKSAPSSIASIDPDFKLPQIWRSSLATDIVFPNEMMLTLEGIYTKDINAILQRNANMMNPPAAHFEGSDKRSIYPDAANYAERINPGISEAMVLDNTSKGYSYSLSAQLQMPLFRNFNAMVAYTYSMAKDMSGNPGSQAASAWSNNLSVNGPNNLELSYSQYLTPHKLIGSLSYKIEYAKHFASTFSIFYSGYHSGSFSYRYSNDMNQDNINGDLMYIPKDRNDIIFVDKNGFTAAEQADAFWAYVEQDNYLRNHKGKYAERNGVRNPWYNRFDFKFLQDVSMLVGQTRNTLQFSLDILNVGNLINSNWGVAKQQVVSNGSLLRYEGQNAEGVPTFSMSTIGRSSTNPTNRPGYLPTSTFQSVFTTSSTWSIQIGLRYIFN